MGKVSRRERTRSGVRHARVNLKRQSHPHMSLSGNITQHNDEREAEFEIIRFVFFTGENTMTISIPKKHWVKKADPRPKTDMTRIRVIKKGVNRNDREYIRHSRI